jgi:hypothetical protein
MRTSQELSARREALRAEGARLRAQLGSELSVICARLGIVERVVRLGRHRGVRVAVVGVVTLLFRRGPRKALKTAWQLQGLWTIAQPLLRRVLRRA